MEHTVDGKNPAPVEMDNIPLFTKVLYISGGAGSQLSTVWYSHEINLCVK